MTKLDWTGELAVLIAVVFFVNIKGVVFIISFLTRLTHKRF